MTAGTVAIGEDRLMVALDRRCHNAILREAAPDRDPPPIPWIGRRRLVSPIASRDDRPRIDYFPVRGNRR